VATARLPDQALTFEPLEPGHWKVLGGRTTYTVIADRAGGLACSCPGFLWRDGCRHVRELLRRQADGGVSATEDQVTAAPASMPAAILEDPAAQRATIGEVRDGEIPAGEPPEDGPHLELVREIERETAETVDQVDRRLAAIDARQPLCRSLAQLLEDPDTLKPPAAVVPRLAYGGRVTLVVGREKMGGKSTLLTAGAAAVTREREFLDGRCLGGSVLWVSADQEHAAEIAQRAVRFGADPTRFHVLWPREDRFTELQLVLDQVKPTLLVVDTLANFARVDDPHSSAEWPDTLLPLLRLARERDLAVDVSHHAKKSEGGYRDSSAIGANVDLILELRPDAGDPTRRHISALGRWPAPGFTVDLVGDRYQLVSAAELSLDARVLVYIEGHPGCPGAAVRDHIGGRKEDVDHALRRLIAQGAVRDVGNERRHAYEPASVPAAPVLDLDERGDRVPF
jgi:hypothetical protein